jgi:hypothetical protein
MVLSIGESEFQSLFPQLFLVGIKDQELVQSLATWHHGQDGHLLL